MATPERLRTGVPDAAMRPPDTSQSGSVTSPANLGADERGDDADDALLPPARGLPSDEPLAVDPVAPREADAPSLPLSEPAPASDSPSLLSPLAPLRLRAAPDAAALSPPSPPPSPPLLLLDGPSPP